MRIPNTNFDRILREFGDEIYPEHLINVKEDSTTEKFTVREKLEKLKEKTYSDIYSKDKDGKRLQWVNYVQEGGGTLGLALVGYAFVLEYVGIRFLRLAGTSAGAINTLFLAAIGKKDEPKTPELFDMLNDPQRFDIRTFVDTKIPFLREAIFLMGKGKGLGLNILYIIAFAILLAFLITPLSVLLGTSVLLTFLLILLCVAGSVFFLVKNIFQKYAFGINSGEVFLATLERELASFGIHSTEDLNKAYKDTTISRSALDLDGIELELSQNLYRNEKIERATNHLNRLGEKIKIDYSIVATDINNQFKVVFPAESMLYFDEPANVNPAQYVRASMAVPGFFEPQYFPDKPTENHIGKTISKSCKQQWQKLKGIAAKDVADKGILVDGGVLSNFPINILHNQNIRNPRMPIMGARLMDDPQEQVPANKGLGIRSYLGKLISTLRANEDNGFLASNPFYRTYCIADIDVAQTKVNWLNFNLTDEEKKALFRVGMLAAIAYLEKFDWKEYKLARIQLHESLNRDLRAHSAKESI